MKNKDIKNLTEEDIIKLIQSNEELQKEVEEHKKETRSLKSQLATSNKVSQDLLKHLLYLERAINDRSLNASHNGYYSFINNITLYIMALSYRPEALSVLFLMVSLMNTKNTVQLSRDTLVKKMVVENVTNVKSDKANVYDKRETNFMNPSAFDSAIRFLIENKFIREIKGGKNKKYQVNGWIAFNGKFKELYQGDALMKNSSEYYYEKIGDVLIDGDYVIPVRFGTRRMKRETYGKEWLNYDFMFKKIKK